MISIFKYDGLYVYVCTCRLVQTWRNEKLPLKMFNQILSSHLATLDSSKTNWCHFHQLPATLGSTLPPTIVRGGLQYTLLQIQIFFSQSYCCLCFYVFVFVFMISCFSLTCFAVYLSFVFVFVCMIISICLNKHFICLYDYLFCSPPTLKCALSEGEHSV